MLAKLFSLSGGQRQAVSLVMATLTPIDFLILDEHTAALDPVSYTHLDVYKRQAIRFGPILCIQVKPGFAESASSRGFRAVSYTHLNDGATGECSTAKGQSAA